MKCTFIKARFRVYPTSSEAAAQAMMMRIINTQSVRSLMSQSPTIQTEAPPKSPSKVMFRRYWVEVYYGYDIHGEKFAKALEDLQSLINPLKTISAPLRPRAHLTHKLAEKLTW